MTPSMIDPPAIPPFKASIYAPGLFTSKDLITIIFNGDEINRLGIGI